MTDRRRINGPLVRYPLELPQEQPRNTRRKIFFKTGILSKSNGSAYMELGQLKVIVNVIGPRSIPQSRQNHDKGYLQGSFTFAPWAEKEKRAYGGDELSTLLLGQLLLSLTPSILLDHYPKSQIDVHCMILSSDDNVYNCLAAAITCASAALVNAGIECKDFVTACSIAQGDSGGIIVDPSEYYKVNGVIAYMASRKLLTNIWLDGEASETLIEEACGAAEQLSDIIQLEFN
jgi:exosome complex component MTR3